MKNLFLTAILLGLVGLSSFAQGVIPRSLAPKLKMPSIPDIKEHNFQSDSLLFNDIFTPPFELDKNILPEPNNSLLDFRREIRPILAPDPVPIDRMPILDPKGNFAMKYYEPDSSINFTILKKDFK